MKFLLLLSLFLSTICIKATGQDILYFHKIEALAADTKQASVLYNRLDSVKQTRRPNDSKVKVFFDRDVDFGYRHQRITIIYNSIRYQANLLVKNDIIVFSCIMFDPLYGYGAGYKDLNRTFKLDTPACIEYLGTRNTFYHSNKKIIDLETELTLDIDYALRGGDGYLDTEDKKHLDTLVKKKDIRELDKMLKSINCEIQTYGVTGFGWLKNKKVAIPEADVKLIIYIKKRNSVLQSMAGDIGPIPLKVFRDDQH